MTESDWPLQFDCITDGYRLCNHHGNVIASVISSNNARQIVQPIPGPECVLHTVIYTSMLNFIKLMIDEIFQIKVNESNMF